MYLYDKYIVLIVENNGVLSRGIYDSVSGVFMTLFQEY